MFLEMHNHWPVVESMFQTTSSNFGLYIQYFGFVSPQETSQLYTTAINETTNSNSQDERKVFAEGFNWIDLGFSSAV